MAETFYVILKTGDILKVTGVTALAIDNTLTIKPGDFYRNKWFQQTVGIGLVTTDFSLLEEKGDATGAPAGLRDVSYLCSYWKFTRGASLPIMRHRWLDVEAICNEIPNRACDSDALYIPLRSGNVAVISGMKAATAALKLDDNLLVYPGDFYRNEYVVQTQASSGTNDVLLTNQFGDARDGDALNSESWNCSHLSFDRDALIKLYIPEANVVGGPSEILPNLI